MLLFGEPVQCSPVTSLEILEFKSTAQHRKYRNFCAQHNLQNTGTSKGVCAPAMHKLEFSGLFCTTDLQMLVCVCALS